MKTFKDFIRGMFDEITFRDDTIKGLAEAEKQVQEAFARHLIGQVYGVPDLSWGKPTTATAATPTSLIYADLVKAREMLERHKPIEISPNETDWILLHPADRQLLLDFFKDDPYKVATVREQILRGRMLNRRVWVTTKIAQGVIPVVADRTMDTLFGDDPDWQTHRATEAKTKAQFEEFQKETERNRKITERAETLYEQMKAKWASREDE